jgi:hypothetical protein
VTGLHPRMRAGFRVKAKLIPAPKQVRSVFWMFLVFLWRRTEARFDTKITCSFVCQTYTIAVVAHIPLKSRKAFCDLWTGGRNVEAPHNSGQVLARPGHDS